LASPAFLDGSGLNVLVAHLIGTAIGWGGNQRYAAVHDPAYPKDNDGKTVHKLTVKDVPVDGFWLISLYNGKVVSSRKTTSFA
jgi:hypothetical protein